MRSQETSKISLLCRIQKKIEKIGNLSCIPSATEVRKMGSTAVARNCSKDEALLLAKQMNHDPKVASDYYEAVRSDRDRASMYHTIAGLRKKSDTNDSSERVSLMYYKINNCDPFQRNPPQRGKRYY